MRAQREETSREETDRLSEQLEQVRTKVTEDEAAMRQQVLFVCLHTYMHVHVADLCCKHGVWCQISEEFEKKREIVEEENRNETVCEPVKCVVWECHAVFVDLHRLLSRRHMRRKWK